MVLTIRRTAKMTVRRAMETTRRRSKGLES
jgi:hypothetical protein